MFRETEAEYRKLGASQEIIDAIGEYDFEVFCSECAQSIITNNYVDIFEEWSYKPAKTRKISASNPFLYGFNDSRLEYLWKNGSELEKKIMRYIAMGFNMTETSKLTNISRKKLYSTVNKMEKRANEYIN